MRGITTWRDEPVLEAILRLARAGRLPTANAIAEEARLHLGDVYDAIAVLTAHRYVRIGNTEKPGDAPDLTLPLRERLFAQPAGHDTDTVIDVLPQEPAHPERPSKDGDLTPDGVVAALEALARDQAQSD
jgi:hypothetical protein